jgi:16S rRNA (uracil1498-N3)-methyltransferase
MKVGDEIIVQDAQPRRFQAYITELNKTTITILPFVEVRLPQEPAVRVTLLQAMVSEQNIDLILQKTTELGVTHIVLFPADRSPHTIKSERIVHKMTRWNNILTAACEQSGRAIVPQLTMAISLPEALSHVHGTLVLLDIDGNKHSTGADAYTLLVGPEGGFTDLEKIQVHNAVRMSIGTYMLRAETAAIAGVTLLNHI